LKGISRAVLKPFLRRYAETEFGLWKVSEVTLFSSVLTPEGSSYTVELRRPLPAG
jgi:2'-5' RNA ligase